MRPFVFPSDRPFTMMQRSANANGMTGVVPVAAAGSVTGVLNSGYAYWELAAGGIGGIFEFGARWPINMIRLTMDCPNDVTYTFYLVEDGIETIFLTGGPGVTDLVYTDPLPIMPGGHIRTVVSAPAAGTVTIRVTAQRAEVFGG